MEEYLDAAKEEMTEAMDALVRSLAKVRTGRATPKLLEGVQVTVQSYGTTMPLTQLATVQAPDARLLVVQPWDKTTLADVERAIVSASLGLNPSNDGQLIRVPVPPLTKERRQDLVKQVRKVGEDTKVRLRHVRRETNDVFKEAEKGGELSEDAARRLLQQVQDITDGFVKDVDQVVADKEAEVLEV